MIKPVAARLRHLLEEDPGRSKCSLLITGHSAGGAVAALLYSHMLSTSNDTESELNILTGCFKRVHCISFGAPPVSLLPLAKPNNPALRKSLFYSFVNEGDPVPRADKAYIRSLLDLYATPAPGQACPLTSGLGKSSSSPAVNKTGYKSKKSKTQAQPEAPLWPVPEAALSNASCRPLGTLTAHRTTIASARMRSSRRTPSESSSCLQINVSFVFTAIFISRRARIPGWRRSRRRTPPRPITTGTSASAPSATPPTARRAS